VKQSKPELKSGKSSNRSSGKKPVQKWQLQTAKAQFSELFRRAQSEGPQWVTRQGKDEVVVVSADVFERMVKLAKQPKNIVDFFRHSPLADSGLVFEREDDYGREVEL
jgi:antitoxin Phd